MKKKKNEEEYNDGNKGSEIVPNHDDEENLQDSLIHEYIDALQVVTNESDRE